MYSISISQDLRRPGHFLHVPEEVYREDPLYVPEVRPELMRQLDVNRNPYFRKADLTVFVCLRDGVPVGRATMSIRKAQYAPPFIASFGFFECIRDETAFGMLLGSLEESCRSRGIGVLEGPFSPHHYGVAGFQLDGFDIPPAFLEAYTPPYYAEFFTGAGFRVAQIGRTWHGTIPFTEYAHRVASDQSPLKAGRYSLRTLSLPRLHEDVASIAAVLEESFARNWHSLPISTDEYIFAARQVQWGLNPELVSIVECDGRPVGALVFLLDINPILRQHRGRGGIATLFHAKRMQKSIRSLVAYAVGIVPDHRHSRVGYLLYRHVQRLALQYDNVRTTWITKGNRRIENLAARHGFTPVKSFGVFEKQIDGIPMKP
ncbi:MAG: hypothetical protein KAJ12_00005, partial [Bacteroidetes bacterium]|nr:hypothetical protein [Bacteroidota bacterium]